MTNGIPAAGALCNKDVRGLPGCQKRRSTCCCSDVRSWHIADIGIALGDVRFSNRPFWVKRFQTIHHRSVDVSRGLALLFGLGTRALPLWGSKTRWSNLSVGLAASLTAGSSGHAHSPHPSSREGHHSTTRWSSSFLLSHLIL